jgi:hypothetical protein
MANLEQTVAQFLDLRVEFDSRDGSSQMSSEEILAKLDRIYAMQRQLKLAIQEKQRRELARQRGDATAADADDDSSYGLEQVTKFLFF